MIPIDKVKKIVERYISLEKELSTGRLNPKLLAKKSKEYSDLKDIVPQAKEYISFEKNKKDLDNIILDKKNDKEIILLAEKELKDAEKKREKNEKDIKIFLLPKDSGSTLPFGGGNKKKKQTKRIKMKLKKQRKRSRKKKK